MSEGLVKCVVWDLDDTIWDGVLLEGDDPRPRTEIVSVIDALDRRGILHAVASRGDREQAAAHLRALGLFDRFVHLEIGWGAKSDGVRRTAEALGLNLDSFAFVDNDPSEVDEVARALPQVRCYPVSAASGLTRLPGFSPAHVTEEAAMRRELYVAERRRAQDEESAGAHRSEFLAELGLVMTVRPAGQADLLRAHELTVRTHQLNTSGRTYSLEQLQDLLTSPMHEILVAELDDRYGGYGTIGLAVSETRGDDEVLVLLLMSCRVISRGVGGVLLGQFTSRARQRGRRPCAEFVPSPVNRIMLVTLRFAGFVQVHAEDEVVFLANESGNPTSGPDHVVVRFVDRGDPS